MKHKWLVALASLAFGLAMVVPDIAEAKRMGGGRSVGQQSGMAKKAPAQPPQQANQATNNPGAAAAAKPQGNRWLGPIAGLAAGLGLAALASHLGLGEAFGTMILMGLIAVGLLIAFRMYMARRQAGGGLAMGGAGANGATPTQRSQAGDWRSALGAGAAGAGAGAAASAGSAVASPAGTQLAHFDADQFVRSARSQFLRLQSAFDKREIGDLREFTSPAMFAELEKELAERGDVQQVTDVVQLNAAFVGTEAFGASGQSEVVGVRFNGMIRESEGASPEAFDEVWNFSRPADRSTGWVLSGIEQVEASQSGH